jgi:hypothetical protein
VQGDDDGDIHNGLGKLAQSIFDYQQEVNDSGYLDSGYLAPQFLLKGSMLFTWANHSPTLQTAVM